MLEVLFKLADDNGLLLLDLKDLRSLLTYAAENAGDISAQYGLVSKQSLMQNYGLSEAQARQFFKKPTTLRLNVEGSAQFVGDASLYFGLRVVGD